MRVLDDARIFTIALKMGDESGWRSLFAPWRVVSGYGGRPMLDMTYATNPSMFAREWDRSRFLIMGEVLDARVYRTEKEKRVLESDEDSGLPAVDRVVVWIDHYGLFDKEHRVFQKHQRQSPLGARAPQRRSVAYCLDPGHLARHVRRMSLPKSQNAKKGCVTQKTFPEIEPRTSG